MAAQREGILVLSLNPIFFRHLFGRLTHRLACRRLGNRGRHRDEVLGANARNQLQALSERLCLAQRDEVFR